MTSARSCRLSGASIPGIWAAAALAVLLSACAGPAAPPPAAAPPAPAIAAVAPPISLSPRVVEQASAYRAYVARAGAISPGFTGGGDVAQSLKAGSCSATTAP